MIRSHWKKAIQLFVCVVGVTGVLSVNALAQYPGTGGGTGTGGSAAGRSTASAYTFHNNYHIGFERPEAWGLKYFASASLLSGLQPPAPPEGYRAGTVTIGFELGWLPSLDAGQMRIGFNGTTPED